MAGYGRQRRGPFAGLQPQLRILCMHCTQKMQPIIVRCDSSADVSRDPGCRSYLNPTPGIPRASRFPAALQSMNMEQRMAHKKFNASILLSQAGDPGRNFLVSGGGFSFCGRFRCFKIEKPVLAEPEKFGNRGVHFHS